jgi:hypothetical protein
LFDEQKSMVISPSNSAHRATGCGNRFFAKACLAGCLEYSPFHWNGLYSRQRETSGSIAGVEWKGSVMTLTSAGRDKIKEPREKKDKIAPMANTSAFGDFKDT